jgi:hypothetical protein
MVEEHQTPNPGIETPKTKLQTPKKSQVPNSKEIPSSKLQTAARAWSLELGVWCLEYVHALTKLPAGFPPVAP